MNNQITRDIIIDLLPLYLADEVSQDTRELVEGYLQQDPSLLKIVEQSKKLTFEADIPPLNHQELQTKTVQKAKRAAQQANFVLVLAIATSLLFLAFGFDSGGVYWLWADLPQVGFPLFVLMSIFWMAYGNIRWQLNRE